MRKELIGYLKELSDAEYQKKNWLPNSANSGKPKSAFDYSVNFLFDDTTLSTDPESCIGWFLLNQSEADAMKQLTNSIDDVFQKYGTMLSDEQYLQVSEWQSIILPFT